MAFSVKSDYLLMLESESKEIAIRYKEKIKVIQGIIDPFILMNNDPDGKTREDGFPPMTAFHIFSYLVLTHSFYTNEQVKAYKSLSAYKYFEAGFVQNCRARKIGENIVVFCQVI